MTRLLPLIHTLQVSARRPHAPFYTPGHKRGVGASPALRRLIGEAALQTDLPELPELDNLFAPTGAIAQSQALAAQTFGADHTYFLVNGSTCGVMAAIAATCGEGDKIILPRNVHQSVISGLILTGAQPIFIQPPYDATTDLTYGLTVEAIATTLAQHPDTKAVFVLSPTYQGICPDLDAIATVVHAQNLPLIVDEAHGAHFAFHPDLPASALSCEADVVVQSTHKTLGALTQAAMVHLQGDRVDPNRMQRALQLVQSTSPNYLLLASLEAATVQMAEQGEQLMTQTLGLAQRARQALGELPGIAIVQPPPSPQPGFAALDLTRLTVLVRDLPQDGFALDEQLHESLGVTAELPLAHHLSFIISLGNTPDDIARLVQGWTHLTQQATLTDHRPEFAEMQTLPLPTTVLSPRQASFAPTELRSLPESVGEICAETICPYPPGIPVLIPGELITPEAIAYLEQVQTLGGEITGLRESDKLQIVAAS